jgi:hypothetical protein
MSKQENAAHSELEGIVTYVIVRGSSKLLNKWYAGEADPEDIKAAQETIRGLRILAARKYGADYSKVDKLKVNK